jgi:hypothetical protein
MLYVVRAIDQAGVLLRVEYFDDPIYADGCAAGLHVQFLSSVWVNETQVFSHEQPLVRLCPGVID